MTTGVAADAIAAYSGGDGTSDTPYLISTQEDLIQLAVNINSGTIDSAGQYYTLTQNTDLQGGVWTPIGITDLTAFKGNFDFNNKEIYNYTVNSAVSISTSSPGITNATSDYGGLFGLINTGGGGTVTGYAEPAAPVAGSGKALHFDGVDDYVVLPVAGVSNSFPLTVEAWVKPEAGSPKVKNNIISTDDPGFCGHGFGANIDADGSSELAIEYHDGGRAVPGVTFTSGQWYHIAVVYTSGNYKAYVNGELVDDYSYTQKVPDGVDFIRIGRHNSLDPYYYKGSVDEVRVWNTALTQRRYWTTCTSPLPGMKPDWRATGGLMKESGQRFVMRLTGTTGYYPIWIQTHGLSQRRGAPGLPTRIHPL